MPPVPHDSSGVDLKDQEDGNSGTEDPEESNDDSSDDNFCGDEDQHQLGVAQLCYRPSDPGPEGEWCYLGVSSRTLLPRPQRPPHIPVPPSIPVVAAIHLPLKRHLRTKWPRG